MIDPTQPYGRLFDQTQVDKLCIRLYPPVNQVRLPTNKTKDIPMTEWNPDQVLQAAAQEREVRGLDYKQLAHTRMEENLDFAVARIVHLIKYSSSEKMAFDASKYLLERVLGKTPEPESSTDKDDLEDLVRQLADNDND